MDFQVTFSKNALNELEEILKFIGKDDPEAARDFCTKLLAKSLRLNRFPFRHTICPQRANVRKIPVPPYLIYYRINELKHRITILHFWHSARQYPMLP